MVRNIGDLFVKCKRQVTKGHMYHLLVVSDYYVTHRQRAVSFVKCPPKVPNWVTDPFKGPFHKPTNHAVGVKEQNIKGLA